MPAIQMQSIPPAEPKKPRPEGKMFKVMNKEREVGTIWGESKKELETWLNMKRMPFTKIIDLV